VAVARANELLGRTGMLPHQRKKTDELSAGMGQIIQFIVTIVHDPELIVMDDPFSGLDPVNTELLKGMLVDLRGQGKSIILSTHQMNQVEELCDRILMISRGRAVLYGGLAEIKSRYRSNSVHIDFKGELGEVPGVSRTQVHRGYTELFLDGGTTPQQVLEYLVGRGVEINRFEIATPPLNDIFIDVVGKSHE
jgi:ABC-2 type transport system ATP-binding protein